MDSTLDRRLGPSDAVVVGLGAMIGAGVFVAFAPAAARAGSWVWASLAVAAVVAVCNALSSARLAAQFPAAGGTYVYGRELLGPLPGFLAGWGFVVGKTASCAAMALTVGLYLWPEQSSVVAAVAVLALTVLSVLGVQRTATASKVLVGVVLAALAVFVVAAFVSSAGSSAVPGAAAPAAVPAVDGEALPGRILGVLGGAGFCFFAFAGYARIATLGEEVRDPGRTIPRAVVIAISVVIAVYAIVLAATVHVLGVQGVAASAAPVLDAAERVPAGEVLAPVVRIAAGIAALGALLGGVLGVSRTTLAMARDRHLPAPLAAVHPTTRTPYVAEICVGVVVAVIVLAADVRQAIGFSSFAVLIYYLVANTAALRLDRRRRGLPAWVPVLGAVGCVIVAGSLPWQSVVGGLVVFVVGGVVYAVTRPRAVTPGVASRA
ncbi:MULTISPECIES: APC family permease [Dietzia]|uniref:APC family permease n=1 Tax=Dietzia TaxID=37914 RepID=UPI000D095FD7|nr:MULTISPECIES: APC family permease [Dietzia]AVM65747.1 amino acid permease [Dietzia sp. oral taxon 368]MCT1639258.1 APC family permease [Dietzia cinnamea]MCT2061129.1 APC family permease [Dietzia cinnamea]MCT2138868.1 APC family permease [Dietzia cinnamea]MCT2174544.1 APC family permease [Dietzia cinnamea]